jgi:hypothetical protein
MDNGARVIRVIENVAAFVTSPARSARPFEGSDAQRFIGLNSLRAFASERGLNLQHRLFKQHVQVYRMYLVFDQQAHQWVVLHLDPRMDDFTGAVEDGLSMETLALRPRSGEPPSRTDGLLGRCGSWLCAFPSQHQCEALGFELLGELAGEFQSWNAYKTQQQAPPVQLVLDKTVALEEKAAIVPDLRCEPLAVTSQHDAATRWRSSRQRDIESALAVFGAAAAGAATGVTASTGNLAAGTVLVVLACGSVLALVARHWRSKRRQDAVEAAATVQGGAARRADVR